MQKPTLDQAVHLLQQVKDQGLDLDRLQKFFDAGLIAGLLKADIDKVGSDLKRIFAGQQILPIPANDFANGGITFVAAALDTRLWLDDQRKFFREVYGKSLPKVKLPPVSAGFGWGVIMASFMGTQWLFDCSRERFGGAWKWTYNSLDTVIIHNDRDAKVGPYSIWCRDRVEADEELKNKSFNDLLTAKISCMTCAECLNLGIWLHWKTGGKHLDVTNVTLCAGSRYTGGDVPNVYWHDRLSVHGYGPGYSCGLLRARQVISC